MEGLLNARRAVCKQICGVEVARAAGASQGCGRQHLLLDLLDGYVIGIKHGD